MLLHHLKNILWSILKGKIDHGNNKEEAGQGHHYGRFVFPRDPNYNPAHMGRIIAIGGVTLAQAIESRAESRAKAAAQAAETAKRRVDADALWSKLKAESMEEMAAQAAKPRPDLKGKRLRLRRRQRIDFNDFDGGDDRLVEWPTREEVRAIYAQPRCVPRNDWPREPLQSPE